MMTKGRRIGARPELAVPKGGILLKRTLRRRRLVYPGSGPGASGFAFCTVRLRKSLVLQLDSEHVSFGLPDVAHRVNDGIAPRERAGCPMVDLGRFAVNRHLGIPVGEVDAEPVWMAVARLD